MIIANTYEILNSRYIYELYTLNHLILISVQRNRSYYYPHFRGDETEAREKW